MRPSKGYIDVEVCPERLRVGYRVWFKGEKRPYTVMAKDKNLVACVKAFSLMKTYIYSIVDTVANVRGTDGFIFSQDWSSHESSVESLKKMRKFAGVSYRNRVALKIERMAKPNAETAKKPLPVFPTM